MLLSPTDQAGVPRHQAGGKLAAHVGETLVDEQPVQVVCLVVRPTG